MTDKIVSLHGKTIADPTQPSPEVVSMAKDLLQMAEAGEISGIMAVWHYRDGAPGRGSAGVLGPNLLGCWEILKHKTIGGWLKDDG